MVPASIRQEMYKIMRVNVYYLVDASEKMIGNRIGTVNAVMEEVIPIFREIEHETDSHVYLKIMKYNTWAQWQTPELTPLDDFIWNDIQAGGKAELGAALNLLGTELMANDSIDFSIVFLLGCEKPTDDFEGVMEKLYTLDDFKNSIRFVLNIEGEFPYEVAYKFTGNEDNIVNAKDSHILKKMMIHAIKSNKGMSRC